LNTVSSDELDRIILRVFRMLDKDGHRYQDVAGVRRAKARNIWPRHFGSTRNWVSLGPSAISRTGDAAARICGGRPDKMRCSRESINSSVSRGSHW